MPVNDHGSATLTAYRRLVQRVLGGGIPVGIDFDACRALLTAGSRGPEGFHALCVLLEGALADSELDIEETQYAVPLLKELARGTIEVEDLL